MDDLTPLVLVSCNMLSCSLYVTSLLLQVLFDTVRPPAKLMAAYTDDTAV